MLLFATQIAYKFCVKRVHVVAVCLFIVYSFFTHAVNKSINFLMSVRFVA